MALGTVLELVTRTDTKFGNVDAAIAGKLDPPIAGGTFDPTLIDLSLGQVQHPGYTQTAEIAFALDPSKTPVIGGSAAVNITGGGFAVTFSSPFVGLDGLTSGAVLETDVDYTFVFLYAEDWIEVAPGVFEDRVLIVPSGIKIATARLADGALGPVPDDAGFDPTAIDLSGNSAPAHTQVGATQLALDGGVTAVNGATCWIAWTGDASAITCDGTTVKWSDGTAGAKTLDGLGTLVVSQHPALAYAVAYLEGEAAAGGGTWGSITGTLADQTDLQAALGAKAPTANPVFTGTVTIPDGALAIADTSGLQTALDAKAPSSSPTLSNPTLTGTVTVPDGALAIADTSGLQAALDSKLEAPVATASIADDAVTFAKLQNASAASRLLGRGSASGAGDFQEITLGSNLSMVGTQLTASGTLDPAADAATTTYTPFWSGAIALSLKDALDNGMALGKYFGLNGDNTFNNTTVLHTALDAILALGGGDLHIAPGNYKVSNIIMRDKVTIVGQTSSRGLASNTQFTAIAGTTGVMFDAPASGASGIYGCKITGSSVTTGSFTGVRMGANNATIHVRNCYIATFRDHCILITGGFQTIEETTCQNGLMNQTRAAKSGVIHVTGGSDHTIRACGVSSLTSESAPAVSDSNIRICGLFIGDFVNACFIESGDYHHCDVGIHIEGSSAARNKLFGVRVDGCAAHGIMITSGAHLTQLAGVIVQRVGRAPNDTSTPRPYDGIHLSGGTGTIIDGCVIGGTVISGRPSIRYAINDTIGQASFINNAMVNYDTGETNLHPRSQLVGFGRTMKVETTVTGAYTLLYYDVGQTKRYTGGAANWTVNNIGVGEIFIENAGSGTITFVNGTSTRIGSHPGTVTAGEAVRLHLSNNGANYRLTAA